MPHKLSICIPTLNRGAVIGETLESIVSQLEAGVEIVIVDGGSTDATEGVVLRYRERFPVIRYVKTAVAKEQSSSEGFDRDCNYAVEIAGGDYCWLMSDDDLLMPGAISRVLEEIQKDYWVVVASTEVRDKDLARILIPSRPDFPRDRIYEPGDMDRFAVDVANHLSFVGAVIIKKALWLSRNREKYFGSAFVHVGVIFDEPIGGRMLLISIPLISIRYGVGTWIGRAFQIWMFDWPRLLWSFSTISEKAKLAVSREEPWKRPTTLLFQRVLGTYSILEYRKFLVGRLQSRGRQLLAWSIARMPRSLLYLPYFLYARIKFANSAIFVFDLKNNWIEKKRDK